MKLYAAWKRFTSRILPATKHDVEEIKKLIMKTKADLDAFIANELPGKIEAAVEAALEPVIQAIKDSAGAQDLTDEITALENLGSTVGAKVASDLTPPPPAPTP